MPGSPKAPSQKCSCPIEESEVFDEHHRPSAEATAIAQLYASAAELKIEREAPEDQHGCKRVKIQTEQCHQGSRLCTLTSISNTCGYERKSIDSESLEGELEFLTVSKQVPARLVDEQRSGLGMEPNRDWTQPSAVDGGQTTHLMPRL
ncbi:hypothetical protein ACHAPG_003577 [Botrytis cinerea]